MSEEDDEEECVVDGDLCIPGEFYVNASCVDRTNDGDYFGGFYVLGTLRICDQGTYCPSTATTYLCPEGYYCPDGSFEPISCPQDWDVTRCPLGSRYLDRRILLYIFLILTVVYYVVLYLIVAERWIRKTIIALLRLATSRGQQSEHKDVRKEDEIFIIDSFKRINEIAQVIEERLKQKKLFVDTSIEEMRKATIDMDSFDNMQQDFRGLQVEFRELSLELQPDVTTTKKILSNASGAIRAAAITGLMGSTGSGKTTLLNILRGATSLDGGPKIVRRSGQIFVNNQQVPSLHVLSSSVAFVPQDNVVYEDLTVTENISFSCCLFNPYLRGCQSRQASRRRQLLVQDVIRLMFLNAVSNSIIGSISRRGISGGERKRVSIAMEIVKEPQMLILDEPTTGLDASTSAAVLASLRAMANRGLTILLTIHQPRQEAYLQMDNVYCLVSGGRLVYGGRTELIAPYFQKLGFERPVGTNLADYLLDITAGLYKPRWTKRQLKQGVLEDFLSDQWRRRRRHWSPPTMDEMPPADYQEPARFLLITKNLLTDLRRSFIRHYRKVILNILEVVLVAFVANILLQATAPDFFIPFGLSTYIQFSTIIISFLGGIKGIFLFGGSRNEETAYLRDLRGGMPFASFYISRILANIDSILLVPSGFLFGAYYAPGLTFRQSFMAWWYAVIVLYIIYAAWGIILYSILGVRLAPIGLIVMITLSQIFSTAQIYRFIVVNSVGETFTTIASTFVGMRYPAMSMYRLEYEKYTAALLRRSSHEIELRGYDQSAEYYLHRALVDFLFTFIVSFFFTWYHYAPRRPFPSMISSVFLKWKP